jgi:hypothetical protein
MAGFDYLSPDTNFTGQRHAIILASVPLVNRPAGIFSGCPLVIHGQRRHKS